MSRAIYTLAEEAQQRADGLVGLEVKSTHDQLLEIAVRVEALLTRQHWLIDGDSPESALLRDCRAAIAQSADFKP